MEFFFPKTNTQKERKTWLKKTSVCARCRKLNLRTAPMHRFIAQSVPIRAAPLGAIPPCTPLRQEFASPPFDFIKEGLV